MSDNSQKIQFNKAKLDILKSKIPDVGALEYQIKIFNHMASYLVKYLDLKFEDIKLLINQSAQQWQETHSVPMSQFAVALPQERLIMAEQFKNEAANIFKENLLTRTDFDNLKAVIEHALIYYMKEFATR